MSDKAVAPVPPQYYAALDKVAEGLGNTGSANGQILARRQLELYAVPQILGYLEATCPGEEVKRRQSGQRSTLFICFVIGWISLLLVICFWLIKIGKTSTFTPFISIMNVPTMLLPIFITQMNFNVVKIKGLCVMVAEYAGVEQVPLLIDSLHFVDTRLAIKQKLAVLLPMYLQTDVPPLSTRLRSLLARELKTGFASIIKQKNTLIVEQDASFLAAILIYFEREISQGRALPEEVIPTLKRFAKTSTGNPVTVPQWAMLQSATEECLSYVGAGK